LRCGDLARSNPVVQDGFSALHQIYSGESFDAYYMLQRTSSAADLR